MSSPDWINHMYVGFYGNHQPRRDGRCAEEAGLPECVSYTAIKSCWKCHYHKVRPERHHDAAAMSPEDVEFGGLWGTGGHKYTSNYMKTKALAKYIFPVKIT